MRNRRDVGDAVPYTWSFIVCRNKYAAPTSSGLRAYGKKRTAEAVLLRLCEVLYAALEDLLILFALNVLADVAALTL